MAASTPKPQDVVGSGRWGRYLLWSGAIACGRPVEGLWTGGGVGRGSGPLRWGASRWGGGGGVGGGGGGGGRWRRGPQVDGEVAAGRGGRHAQPAGRPWCGGPAAG